MHKRHILSYLKPPSESDIIAIGVVMAVAECGGPTIPLRMGRVDATGPGPTGVPRPEQDLGTHTESFRKQGFTKTEMISLVACGHTFGGVRSPDFPEVVATPADGSQLLLDFDTTPKFDNAVQVIVVFMNEIHPANIFCANSVTEYLKGTTQNPLAVNSNQTILSDFRIFSSDKNATMKRSAFQKLITIDTFLILYQLCFS